MRYLFKLTTKSNGRSPEFFTVDADSMEGAGIVATGRWDQVPYGVCLFQSLELVGTVDAHFGARGIASEVSFERVS